MGDVDDSEEGIVNGFSSYPIVRRHHRRGKRKPRPRRRTLSAELTPGDESTQNSSKEDMIKYKPTKESILNSNLEQEKSLRTEELNTVSLKTNEILYFRSFYHQNHQYGLVMWHNQ